MLVFEKAVVFASLVLEFSLFFAKHVHANRVVIVFWYWIKQLRTTSLYYATCSFLTNLYALSGMFLHLQLRCKESEHFYKN